MDIALLLLLCLSTLFALLTGRAAEAGSAVLDGARAAVSFALELCGALCLWSAAMELLERGGWSARHRSPLIARRQSPVRRQRPN